MSPIKELTLLSAAISKVEVELSNADTVDDQIEVLERLRALQHCQNLAIRDLLDRRKNSPKV